MIVDDLLKRVAIQLSLVNQQPETKRLLLEVKNYFTEFAPEDADAIEVDSHEIKTVLQRWLKEKRSDAVEALIEIISESPLITQELQTLYNRALSVQGNRTTRDIFFNFNRVYEIWTRRND